MSSSKSDQERLGHRLLAVLGLIVILGWFYFACLYYQDWRDLGFRLLQQPDRVEVDDQGLMNLAVMPLLALFSTLVAWRVNRLRKKGVRPGPFDWLGGFSMLMVVLGLPLLVINQRMDWYVNTASPVPYQLCSTMVHGQGKNTWRSHQYVREDLNCP